MCIGQNPHPFEKTIQTPAFQSVLERGYRTASSGFFLPPIRCSGRCSLMQAAWPDDTARSAPHGPSPPELRAFPQNRNTGLPVSIARSAPPCGFPHRYRWAPARNWVPGPPTAFPVPASGKKATRHAVLKTARKNRARKPPRSDYPESPSTVPASACGSPAFFPTPSVQRRLHDPLLPRRYLPSGRKRSPDNIHPAKHPGQPPTPQKAVQIPLRREALRSSLAVHTAGSACRHTVYLPCSGKRWWGQTGFCYVP